MKKTLLLFLLLPFFGFAQTVDLASWALTSNGNVTTKQSYIQSTTFTTPNPVTYNSTGAFVTAWNNNDFAHDRYVEISIAPTSGNTILVSNLIFQQASIPNGSTPGPSSYIAKYYISENGTDPGTYNFYNSASTALVAEESIASNPSKSIKINETISATQKLIVRLYTKGNDYNNIKWQFLANTLKFTGKLLGPLAGPYVIGSAPTADFSNIKTAINTLNAVGVSAPVTFLIDESQTITSQLTINHFTGTSTTNTVTIKPNLTKEVSISGSIANGSIIALNDGDNIIISGNNSADGTNILNNNKLKIYNTLSSDGTSRLGIWLHNGSENNRIENLTVEMNFTNVQNWAISTGIMAGSSTIDGNGNNINNTVQNVIFTKVKQAIAIKGQNQSNTGWKILNNKIESSTDDSKAFLGIYVLNANNYSVSNNILNGIKLPADVGGTPVHSGIYLETANNGTITNNAVSNVANERGTYSGYGIYVKGNNNVINRNTISTINSNSTTSGSYGIRLEGNNTTINNNNIRNIFSSTGVTTSGIYISGNDQTIYNNYVNDVASLGGGQAYSQDGFGIYINTGTNIKLYHNSVKLTTNQPNGSSAALYIKDGSSFDIRNNIFINLQTTGSMRFAIYTESSDLSKFTTLNNNNYFSNQHIGSLGNYYGGNQKTTLIDWRNSVSADGTSREANSKNINPVFINNTLDLDASNTANTTLIGTTDLLSTVLNDIYGRLRINPNMGAYEISTCTPTGDQTTFTPDYWTGYVYKWTGTTPNPTFEGLPGNDNVVYIGTVTESKLFDRSFDQATVSGVTTNICGVPPSSKYLVRYKMKVTTEAGDHLFEVGGDDGTRLYIDGKLVIERWNDHGYTKDQLKYTLTAGTHEFVLDFYQNIGAAQVSFSYGLPKGNPNEYGDNVWNVYGYNVSDISLPAANYTGMYVDPVLNFSTQTYWGKALSPSYYSGWQGAPMPINNFAIAYKRRGFPCGNYQLELPNYDDDVNVIIDGVSVFSAQGYKTTTTPIPGTYLLNKNSTIEIRLKENTGDANLALKFKSVPNVYNGTGPAPTATTPITISSNMTLKSNIEVCSCTIDPNITLTVDKGVTLSVVENIINNGTLIIEDSGSLLQTNTTATAYQGAQKSFVVKRNTQAVRRYDFTYWSSPVKRDAPDPFTMHELSPGTLLDKYNRYDSNTSGWAISLNGTEEMLPAVGYTIRAPQTFSITNAAVYSATFTGIPNNGTYKITPVATKWSLVGNPYPSAIEADKFISINAAAGRNVGALYFWTHNSPPAADANAATYSYSSSDYAVYSLSGSTKTSKGATSQGNQTAPTGYIAAGVSFFIQPSGSGDIQFTNAMRIGGNNTQFFKTTESTSIEKNRLWLNLTNSEGAFKQALVGYIEGATDSWDKNYDAVTMAGNSFIDFYSINGATKLAIQGRALPFEETDRVPLGYKTTIAGDFTISIDEADGLFTNQNVYLEDKTTGTITDLKASDYTFKTEIGTFIDRFTISYTKKSLGTGDFETLDNSVLVSVNAKAIKVNSTKETISEVTIYDITGKTLYNKKKVGDSELLIPNLQSSNQILLVKVTLENDYSTTKKIIFQ